MGLRALAIIIPIILLAGCGGGQGNSPSSQGPTLYSLATQNILGNKINGVVLTPNASTVVKVYNNNDVTATNIQFNTDSLPSGVTTSGACTSIAPKSSCSITLTSTNSATGTGNLTMTGSNINAVKVPVTVTPVNISITALQRGNETNALLRGLKYQELQLNNSTGYTVALQSTNDIAPSVPNLKISSDPAHTEGTCLSSATNGTCNFWLNTDNGPDVGQQPFDSLTFTYLVNNENIETQTFPFTGSNVETDLYMAGVFQTNPNACNDNGMLTQCYDLAKWDGTQWNAVGGQDRVGDGDTDLYPVQDITTDPNGNIDLLLSGDPAAPLSQTTNYLASWDGVHWGNMGGGIPGFEALDLNVTAFGYLVWDMATDPKNPILYFSYQNSQVSDQWVLGSWSPNANNGQGVLNPDVFNFSQNIPGFVGAAMVANKGKLYIAWQNQTGPSGVVSASTQDLTSWTQLPRPAKFGMFGVFGLLVNNDKLYLMGVFAATYKSRPSAYVQSYDLTASNPAFQDYIPSGGKAQTVFVQQVVGDTVYFTSYDNTIYQQQLFSASQTQPLPITQTTLLGSDPNGFIGTIKALVVTESGSLYLTGIGSSMNGGAQSTGITKQVGGTWKPLDDRTSSSDIQGFVQQPSALILTPTLTIK